MARNCRNRGVGNKIGEERRLEYGNNNGQRRMIEEGNRQDSLNRRSNSLQLDFSNNRFAMFTRAIDNTSYYSLDNGDMLREEW